MGRVVKKRDRATPAEIVQRKTRAYAAVRRLRTWFGKGEVAAKLPPGDPNLGRTLGLLVADGKLKQRGDRRLTQYQVRA